jgi:hypothetical protein
MFLFLFYYFVYGIEAECLVVGRLDSSFKSVAVSSSGLDSVSHPEDFIQCFGLLGIIQLISGIILILYFFL